MNRMRGVRGRVLDAKPGQSRLDGCTNGRGTILRICTEPIFEIAVDRKTTYPRQEGGVRDGFIAGDGANPS